MKNTFSNPSRKASVGREERHSTRSATIHKHPEQASGKLRSGKGSSARPASATSASAEARSGEGFAYERIKLAMDVHATMFMVSRQLENSTPQPPQQMSREEFLRFAARQKRLAREVHSCYEAGAFGYGLHRELEAMGIKNVVIRPVKLDENGKNTRTDKTDTRELAARLDRYVAGNTKALPVIRVPTVQEEVTRMLTRQREMFKRELNRWRSRGKSLLLYWGIRVTGRWYRESLWGMVVKQVSAAHPEEVAGPMLEHLSEDREMALAMEQRLVALTHQVREAGKRRLERQAAAARRSAGGTAKKARTAKAKRQARATERERAVRIVRILGIGPLSWEQINAEIGDWWRFTNRRQVASYTGLCPGALGTGGKVMGLKINRSGNRRLRAMLVELAWLMTRYQGNYGPVRRWRWAWSGKNGVMKKKAIVAVARQLAVDLWRLQTGRTTAAKLGLVLADE